MLDESLAIMLNRTKIIVFLICIIGGCASNFDKKPLYKDKYIMVEKHGTNRLSINGDLVLDRNFKAKTIKAFMDSLGSESFLIGVKTRFSFNEWVAMSSQISLAGGQTYYLTQAGEIWTFDVVEH